MIIKIIGALLLYNAIGVCASLHLLQDYDFGVGTDNNQKNASIALAFLGYMLTWPIVCIFNIVTIVLTKSLECLGKLIRRGVL